MQKDDITGRLFNKWTVLEKTKHVEKRGWSYLVQCSCEDKTIKELSRYDIESGRSKSCGCIKKSEEHIQNLSIFLKSLIVDGRHGTAGKRFTDLTKKYPEKYGKKQILSFSIINGIKSSATKRKLEYKLNDLDAFEKYCLGDCFYCGIKSNWPETHNGIDRVDNSKGYVKNNCVSSCSQCNKSKNDLSLSEFKLRICKIYNFFILNNKEEWLQNNILLKETFVRQNNFNCKSAKTELAMKYPENYGLINSSYAQRVWMRIRYASLNNCSKKNLNFDLDPLKAFENYIIGTCNYCGLKPQFPHTRNGIDRVDSNKGYIEENCVSCCEFCNQAKLDYSLDEFKEWIIRIYTHLNTAEWNFKE